MQRPLILCVTVAVMAACTPAHNHTVHGCSPFQTGKGMCFGPFPNAWFEQAGPTPTGEQVILPTGALPNTSVNEVIDPTEFGKLDGFSPGTQIIVYFPQGVEATQLTPAPTSTYEDRIAFMQQPSAPIVLLDVATHQRVPFFAELDANAMTGQRQALLIHPAVKLGNGKRYAVAIFTSLHDAAGHAFAAEGQFADWVHGKLTPSEDLWEISNRLDDDATAFAAAGVAKETLALAWDFDTASDVGTTGQLIKMTQQALAVPASSLSYTIDSAQPDTVNFPNADKVVIGTFQSPSFEAGPDPSPLKYDANHAPVMGAPASWRFVADVPKCVETAPGPVPLVVIGHGLFGTAWADIGLDDTNGLLQKLCMVAIGANWVGLSGEQVLTGAPPNEPEDFIIMAQVLNDPNQFDLITGRLQQAHVNFQILTRLAMNALASDPAFQVNGHAAYDPTQVYYWGASNGGIQGTTYLSLSNVVDRGVLNVPGADWTLLMWRSYDFTPAYIVLQATYPDPYDQQLIMAMTQSMFDKTDPIEFSQHLIGTDKQALFQESEGDAEVTNVATRMEMRSLNVKPLLPQLEPVYGLTPAAGPLNGLVYAQWSVDPSPLPPFADSPSADNLAHDDMRWIPEVLDQTQQFLQPGGQVVNTCATTCVYPVTSGTSGSGG